MNYSEFRDQAQTGDVLLAESTRVGGVLIRMLTGQQASHVALLVWIAEGLWVAEMLGRTGYTLSPASERVPELAEHGQVYWGRAPQKVRWKVDVLRQATLSFRGHRYSWWTLITVWCSQVTRRRWPRSLVCSTLVEKVWESVGVCFDKTPDPGDFFRLCESVTPLTIDPRE